MRIFAVAILLSAGCAPRPESASRPPARGSCDAAPVQALIGRRINQDLGWEAKRLSGARIFRWLAPGSITTMEYRADRLNIHFDANDRIVRLDCG
jgi:hypothetical protein